MRSSHTGLMFVGVVCLLIAGWNGSPLHAQSPPAPNEEPSSNATLFERTDSGNVAQSAVLSFGAGERELKRARKMTEKLGELDGKKRESTEKKIVKAYENAATSFLDAIRSNPKMVEAYVGLGRAYRASGKFAESLQVSAQGLKVAPADNDLFTGWAESMMGLNRLGDATQAYGQLLESNPARAEILMGAMKAWLEERRADPGEMAPDDVEKLAGWIAQQEDSSS